MDGSDPRVTLELRATCDARTATLLSGAVADVEYWLRTWSYLAASVLRGPVTVLLDAGSDPPPASAAQVVVPLDPAVVPDVDAARTAVLTAALQGTIEACQRFGRELTVEVSAATDVPEGGLDGVEPFGIGEMAVLAHVGDDEDAFESMDCRLRDALTGVALLQDATIVGGFGQWVIGRA